MAKFGQKKLRLEVDYLVNKVTTMGRTSDADQRLMDATLALIWEQSYGAITIDDICQKAGVKKGSFYYFFDSKSELAVAALDRYWKDQKPLWDSQFSASFDPLQRIRNHCDAVYKQQLNAKRLTGHVPGCPFCTVGSEICKQDEAIRAKICDILESKLKYWESAISDAQRDGIIAHVDHAAKARCAAAYFEGLLAQARLHNDAEALASLGDMVCEHLLTGASTRRDDTISRSTNPAAPLFDDPFESTKY